MAETTTTDGAAPTTSLPADGLEAFRKLNRLGAAISNVQPSDEVTTAIALGLVLEHLGKLVAGVRPVIYGYSPDAASFSQLAPAFGARTDKVDPGAMVREVASSRRPVMSSSEQGAVACWPLSTAGQVHGALLVQRDRPGSFTPLEVVVLENLAGQAAQALGQSAQWANVRRDLARKEDELVRLRHAGLLISSRLRLEETLETILQMALEVTGARYGIFRLVDTSGRNLVARAFAGQHQGQPATEPLPVDGNSIMAWVARHRQPLRVADLRAEPWSRIYYPLDRELAMRSELAVPLIGASGRLLGVLNLESPVVGAFSEADSHLLQALATQAIVAIQEARLLDAVQEVTQLLLTQPYQQVLDRLLAFGREFVNPTGELAWGREGDRLELRGSAPESEWDLKVQTIINRYATLAWQNAARQDALRQAQERHAVSEAFAALGDVAANLLHHVNNKVGTIPVRVEGIEDKCAAAVAANPYLATNLTEIEKSARDAMQAARDSLALLHPIHLEPLELAGCVASAVRTARLPAAVQVQVEGLAGLPRVMAGQQSLAMVINNLLANAAEAMAGAGTVTITGLVKGATVELTIRDNGPGIRPEVQERIFELNFSGRRTTNAHKLGFGLWWVKTLMARLGGSIAVESDGQHGTTFRLQLPVAENSA